MKKGTFFEIPEKPSDVDTIRRRAALLNEATRPAWLDDADRDYYRYVGSGTSAGLTGEARDRFLAEVEELRASGLLVDQDAGDSDAWRMYVPAVCEYQTWSIGIYGGSSPFDLGPAAGAANPVLTRDDVTDVPAVFVADPFMVRREDGWFLFFELLNWRANKGEIGLATSEDGLRWKYERRVLVEPFHLSYPYVFEHDGTWHMIPETRQGGTVRLYQAKDFPWEWSFAATLLEGKHLVDGSVFSHEGRWWMFVGDVFAGKADTLRLYGADLLTGPWREHPRSPVVHGDARIARPAGRVVADGSRVYRFAQNGERAYGEDVRAFEIEELNAEGYREVPAGPDPVLGPGGSGWNARGMHHIDALQVDDAQWLACVDGWTRPEGPATEARKTERT